MAPRTPVRSACADRVNVVELPLTPSAFNCPAAFWQVEASLPQETFPFAYSCTVELRRSCHITAGAYDFSSEGRIPLDAFSPSIEMSSLLLPALNPGAPCFKFA